MRIFVLFSLFLCACAHDRSLIEKPFFYQISKGSNRGVILGTLRTGVSVDELPESVSTAFEAADVYVMENRAGNFDISDRFAKRGATQLTTLLSKSEYEAMVAWLNSGFYADRVQSMLAEDTPVGVAEKLALVRMCNRNYNQCRSMKYLQFVPLEIQIFRRRDAIDVAYLDSESSEESARACLTWSDAQTRSNIISSLTGDDTLKADVDNWAALESAYRSGDTAAIKIAAFRYPTAAIYNCVIGDRNAQFATRIGEILHRYRSPFITVAVGHLENGVSVLDLLRRDGYAVERIGYEKLRKAH